MSTTVVPSFALISPVCPTWCLLFFLPQTTCRRSLPHCLSKPPGLAFPHAAANGSYSAKRCPYPYLAARDTIPQPRDAISRPRRDLPKPTGLGDRQLTSLTIVSPWVFGGAPLYTCDTPVAISHPPDSISLVQITLYTYTLVQAASIAIQRSWRKAPLAARTAAALAIQRAWRDFAPTLGHVHPIHEPDWWGQGVRGAGSTSPSERSSPPAGALAPGGTSSGHRCFLATPPSQLPASHPHLNIPLFPHHQQPCYLHLFSGPHHADSLRSTLAALGAICVCIDQLIHPLSHNLRDPLVCSVVRHFVQHGNVKGVALGVPCRSFSVLWERLALEKPHLRIRSRAYPDGVPHPPARYREYIRSENALVAFAADIMLQAAQRGIPVFFEQPADRGDHTNMLTYRAHLAGPPKSTG